MNPGQLPLGLEVRSPSRLDDFVFGDNEALLQLLQRQLQEHGESQLYIHGPRGSGRSHLLLGQCNAAREIGWTPAYLPGGDIATLSPGLLEGMEQYPLIAIDDVERLAGKEDWEQALFGLFNRARERGARLLFSGDKPPSTAGFDLPDLSSRLAWGVTYRIKPLQDLQRELLLIRIARRRGLHMPAEVARYLLQRHSRDVSELARLIERLDRDSLAEQRRLTIPFVRDRLLNQ